MTAASSSDESSPRLKRTILQRCQCLGSQLSFELRAPLLVPCFSSDAFERRLERVYVALGRSVKPNGEAPAAPRPQRGKRYFYLTEV